MDPDVVARIVNANAAAMSLVTLLVSDMDDEAVKYVAEDPVFTDRATSMAVATLACSAIKAMAEILNIDVMEILQVAGLSAAQFGVDLEECTDDEEER